MRTDSGRLKLASLIVEGNKAEMSIVSLHTKFTQLARHTQYDLGRTGGEGGAVRMAIWLR